MQTKRPRSKNGRPDKKVLAELVQSVVDAAQPDKIILFGSAARGEMGPNSDIDLLIIKRGKFNHHRLTRDIYRSPTCAVGYDDFRAVASRVTRAACSGVAQPRSTTARRRRRSPFRSATGSSQRPGNTVER
jgi:hypothetical protein